MFMHFKLFLCHFTSEKVKVKKNRETPLCYILSLAKPMMACAKTRVCPGKSLNIKENDVVLWLDLYFNVFMYKLPATWSHVDHSR